MFTTDDLQKLDRAIASGHLKVKYQDKEVTYQSLTDQLKARAVIVAQLNAGSTVPGVTSYGSRRINTHFDKGMN